MGWKERGLADLFFRLIDDGYQSYDQENNAHIVESKGIKRGGKGDKRQRREDAVKRINDQAFGKGGHHDDERRTFEPWPGDDQYGPGGRRR